MAKKQVRVFERDGSYWGRTDDGDEFPLNAEQMGNVGLEVPKERTPRSVLTNLPPAPEGAIEHDTPGTSLTRRFLVKNLITDPELAKRYLSQWYEVKPYGGGFNFLLRPHGQPDVPWRPLDPEPAAEKGRGFGYDEFFRDMLDLTADGVFMGTLARGGPVGKGVAGTLRKMGQSALISAGMEAARETAGVPLVGPENVSPTQIGVAGAAAGLAEGGSKVGQLMFDKTRKALLTAGSRIIGIERRSTALGAEEVLSKRAQIPGFGPLKSAEEATASIRQLIKEVGDAKAHPFPESVEADAIVQAAEQAGATIDLRPVVEHLTSLTRVKGKPASAAAAHGALRESALPRNALRKLNEVYDVAAAEGVDLAAAPPTFAIKLKRDLQAAAEEVGGFGIKLGVAGEPTRRAYSTASGLANQAIRNTLTNSRGPAGMTYAEAMDMVAKKTELVGYWDKALNTGATDAEKMNHAIGVISSAFNPSKGGTLEFARNFDKAFGTNIVAEIQEPVIGKAFGAAGEAGLFPRLTATGQVLGAGMIGGGIGFHEGGPAGALTGAVAGGMLASPASILAATKAGQRFINPLAQRIAATDPLARAGLVTAINEATRRFRAAEKERQDAQKP